MDKSEPIDDKSRWSGAKPAWLDLVLDVILSVSRNRLIANSGSVAFFGLMAIFPGIATIVSLYGMFADPHTISNHLNLLTDVFPQSVIGLIRYQIMRVASRGNSAQSLTFFASLFVALWSAASGMTRVVRRAERRLWREGEAQPAEILCDDPGDDICVGHFRRRGTRWRRRSAGRLEFRRLPFFDRQTARLAALAGSIRRSTRSLWTSSTGSAQAGAVQNGAG